MIGNDIVDLALAAQESNWQRKGYLQKIFTSEEQLMISSVLNPDRILWLLWSMKESAYKIYSRSKKIREFAPLKIKCSKLSVFETRATGVICYNDQVYYTESILTENYVHSIAAVEKATLKRIKIEISNYRTNYSSSKADCVSHHGNYLALTYL